MSFQKFPAAPFLPRSFPESQMPEVRKTKLFPCLPGNFPPYPPDAYIPPPDPRAQQNPPRGRRTRSPSGFPDLFPNHIRCFPQFSPAPDTAHILSGCRKGVLFPRYKKEPLSGNPAWQRRLRFLLRYMFPRPVLAAESFPAFSECQTWLFQYSPRALQGETHNTAQEECFLLFSVPDAPLCTLPGGNLPLLCVLNAPVP